MFGYTIISKKRLRELENPANYYAKYYLAGYEAGKMDALYKKHTPITPKNHLLYQTLENLQILSPDGLRKALGLEQIIKEND